MGKKDEEINDLADDLLNNLDKDRQRVSDFLDKLLQIDDTLVISEVVAKLADALTRQNNIRVDAIKAKIKTPANPSDEAELGNDIEAAIGRPFSMTENDDEEGESSN